MTQIHGSATDVAVEAEAAVAAIVRRLRDQAVPLRGGAATWVSRDDRATGARVAALGPHLYDGTSGVAVFLAAYHSVTGDPGALDLALRAVAPLRVKVAQLAQRGPVGASLPIGGFVGLGSFLYTFLSLAWWLRQPELLESASTVAALITPELIVADDRLDVMTGCAGTLLALLRLEREEAVPVAQRQRALDLAVLCGDHLLSRGRAQPSGSWAWPSSDSVALAGFAYGAAGVGHALLQLFERTGQDAWREAARAGFAYERSLYDPRTRTWRNPGGDRAAEQRGWCHGAAGMALSRLGTAAASCDAAAREDLEQALAAAADAPDSWRDHLCCGNAARVDVLAMAGREVERPQWTRRARGLARRLLARAASLRLRFGIRGQESSRDGEEPFAPSLFVGEAGVGYVLLRLVWPERFPCLLRLE